MTAHTFTAISPKAATMAGALDHHAATCSCGYVASSTMEPLVRQYVREHVDFVARREAKARR